MPKACQRMPARLLSINKYFVWSRSYAELEHTLGNILYNICLCFFCVWFAHRKQNGAWFTANIHILSFGRSIPHSQRFGANAPCPLPLHIFLYCFVLCLFFQTYLSKATRPAQPYAHQYTYIFSQEDKRTKKINIKYVPKRIQEKKNPGPQQ